MYLAAIADSFNHQIVGWSMAGKANHGILADALDNALQRRKPDTALIFHSDGEPVFELCFSGSSASIRFRSQDEFYRKLLWQCDDGIVLSYVKDRAN